MPIASYSVLTGLPTAGKVVTSASTHYQITIQATGGPFTAAVNTESTYGSEVLYTIVNNFTPPNAAGLQALASGMHALKSVQGSLALDFVREQIAGKPMVTLSEMTLLPQMEDRNDHATPLANAVDTLLNQAIAEKGTLYVFGSAYADSGKVDGIHNIHMNQGNPKGSFYKDNGAWQDGAIFLYLPSSRVWTAIFIAFQTESWDTNSAGDPVAAA